jgi:hypothetical protein
VYRAIKFWFLFLNSEYTVNEHLEVFPQMLGQQQIVPGLEALATTLVTKLKYWANKTLLQISMACCDLGNIRNRWGPSSLPVFSPHSLRASSPLLWALSAEGSDGDAVIMTPSGVQALCALTV